MTEKKGGKQLVKTLDREKKKSCKKCLTKKKKRSIKRLDREKRGKQLEKMLDREKEERCKKSLHRERSIKIHKNIWQRKTRKTTREDVSQRKGRKMTTKDEKKMFDIEKDGKKIHVQVGEKKKCRNQNG